MDSSEESKAPTAANRGEHKEREGAPQEPSNMFSVVARFIREGGDAQQTADRVAEWLATQAEAWHGTHTFRKGDRVVVPGYRKRATVVRTLAAGQVDVEAGGDVVVLSAASLQPALEVDLSVNGQASRLQQLHGDARLDDMWDVFIVWCTSCRRVAYGIGALTALIADRNIKHSPAELAPLSKLRHVSVAGTVYRACAL